MLHTASIETVIACLHLCLHEHLAAHEYLTIPEQTCQFAEIPSLTFLHITAD